MKPPHNNRVPGSPKEWLAHAQSNLQVARLASEQEEILPQQVCFHAQQAAEKSIKAILLHKGIDFPLIHDIEELIEIAKQNGISVPSEIAEIDSLTPYAVEARYPGNWGEISESDVTSAIRLAEFTVNWAIKIVGV